MYYLFQIALDATEVIIIINYYYYYLLFSLVYVSLWGVFLNDFFYKMYIIIFIISSLNIFTRLSWFLIEPLWSCL